MPTYSLSDTTKLLWNSNNIIIIGNLNVDNITHYYDCDRQMINKILLYDFNNYSGPQTINEKYVFWTSLWTTCDMKTNHT